MKAEDAAREVAETYCITYDVWGIIPPSTVTVQATAHLVNLPESTVAVTGQGCGPDLHTALKFAQDQATRRATFLLWEWLMNHSKEAENG